MLPISLQEMNAILEEKLSELQAELTTNLDFAEVERTLRETMAQLTARMLEPLLAALMIMNGLKRLE